VEELKSGKLRDITVITNSLAVLDKLAPYCKVLLIGGVFRIRRKDFAGSFSERVIKFLCFSKCFLGADAVDIDKGFMTLEMETSSLDEIIMLQSEKSYILVDSTKFKYRSLTSYGKLERASLIITDSKLEDHICDEMKQRDISYILV
jgi:DeoR family lactose phosphotransferase system repressor